MKLLALDTATEMCSAALLLDETLIERCEWAPRRHAVLIMPMLEAVLAEAGVTLRQLDALAVGRGPGSFTGVRIGVGIAQGIAFAAGLPVAPISTLAAVVRRAASTRGAGHVLAALDARMGEVYWGAYQANVDGDVHLLGAERVGKPETVTLPLEAEWLGAGSGWVAHGETLRRRLAVPSWWGDCYPRAADIAHLGALAWRRGQMVSVDRTLPVYLRDEIAEKKTSR